MRQKFRRFLPAFLIALTVQILAPIGATWAAAITASDPLSGALICHGNQQGIASDDEQNGGGRAHDGACSLCCAAQAGASLDSPQPATVAVPYRVAARIIWRDAAPSSMSARVGSHAQARAPPQAS